MKESNHLSNNTRHCSYSDKDDLPPRCKESKGFCTNARHFRCNHSDGTLPRHKRLKARLVHLACFDGNQVSEKKTGQVVQVLTAFNRTVAEY